MISNPLLWKVPVLKARGASKRFLDGLFDTSLRRLPELGENLRDLHLYGSHWTDDKLILLLPHFPSVTRVAIDGSTSITSIGFEELPRYCQSLTSLDISGGRSLAQLSFVSFVKYCRKLVEFKWYSFWEAPSTKQLEWLFVCPLEHLEILSYNPLRQKCLTAIKSFSYLKSLSIAHNNFHTNFLFQAPPMQNNNNENILWPQLTNLSLSPCRDLEDTTLIAFLCSHPRLQKLNLHHATALTDTSVDAMATRCLLNLAHLKLTGNANISPGAVRRLIRRCSDLVYADFSGCNRLIPRLLYSNNVDEIVLKQEKLDKIRQETTA